MPDYFFHFRNGACRFIACESFALADDAAAHAGALRIAQDFVVSATGRVDAAWRDWSVEVCDAAGRLLFTLAFAAANAYVETSTRQRAPAGGAARRGDLSSVAERTIPAARELTVMAAQLTRTCTMLLDRNRYARNKLAHELEAARVAKEKAQRAVARAQAQRAAFCGA